MTAGKIRSLAGLDDTDLTTGSENFENMRSLVQTLSDVTRSEDSKQIASDLISCIDSVEHFHKIGFPRHLGQGEIVFGVQNQPRFLYEYFCLPILLTALTLFPNSVLQMEIKFAFA